MSGVAVEREYGSGVAVDAWLSVSNDAVRNDQVVRGKV